MNPTEYIIKNNLKPTCREVLLDFNKKDKKDKDLYIENLLIYKVAADHLLKEYEQKIKHLEKHLENKNKLIQSHVRKVLFHSRSDSKR